MAQEFPSLLEFLLSVYLLTSQGHLIVTVQGFPALFFSPMQIYIVLSSLTRLLLLPPQTVSYIFLVNSLLCAGFSSFSVRTEIAVARV